MITREQLAAALCAVFSEWGCHENLTTDELADLVVHKLNEQTFTERDVHEARQLMRLEGA